MKTKNIFSSPCNNNFVNIFIGIILMFLIIIFYNNINDFIKKLIININGNIKEGYAQTIDDMINCSSNLQDLTCGTTNTGLEQHTSYLGTCDEQYGPNSLTPDAAKMFLCVDEPIPTIGTPLGNQSSSVTSSACTLLQHRRNEVQRKATTTRADGTSCE